MLQESESFDCDLGFVAQNEVVNVIGYEITVFVHNASKAVGHPLHEYWAVSVPERDSCVVVVFTPESATSLIDIPGVQFQMSESPL